MTAAETIGENMGFPDTLLTSIVQLTIAQYQVARRCSYNHAVMVRSTTTITVPCGGSVIHDGTNNCCMQLRVPKMYMY